LEINMKENELTIRINKPVSEVFEGTIDPANTPKWISSIVEEKVDFPINLGSIYQNTNDGKSWNTYAVSQFEQNKIFELTDNNSLYRVKYTYTPISDTETELEYFEWMEEGKLEYPLAIESLEKLKDVIESK